MKNPYQKSQVLEIVRNLTAEILGSDLDEVQADSALGDALGADSLSFVELSYGLEKRFGISLPKKSILEHAADHTGDERQFVAADGKLTAAGVFLLERSFFGFQPDQLQPGMKRYAVLDITTPDNWANVCYQILDHLPAHCPECQHDTAALAPSGVVVCAGCAASVRPRSGDDILASYVPSLLRELQAEAVDSLVS